MTILYFASFRERIGREEEMITLPDTVKTVSDLVDFLSERDPAVKEAMAERFFVRTAVNQVHADWDTAVTDRDEVAFFPPITGG